MDVKTFSQAELVAQMREFFRQRGMDFDQIVVSWWPKFEIWIGEHVDEAISMPLTGSHLVRNILVVSTSPLGQTRDGQVIESRFVGKLLHAAQSTLCVTYVAAVRLRQMDTEQQLEIMTRWEQFEAQQKLDRERRSPLAI